MSYLLVWTITVPLALISTCSGSLNALADVSEITRVTVRGEVVHQYESTTLEHLLGKVGF